jgi:hypothetical protein
VHASTKETHELTAEEHLARQRERARLIERHWHPDTSPAERKALWKELGWYWSNDADMLCAS